MKHHDECPRGVNPKADELCSCWTLRHRDVVARFEKAEERIAELEDALRCCLIEAKAKNGWQEAVIDRASAALRVGSYARQTRHVGDSGGSK